MVWAFLWQCYKCIQATPSKCPVWGWEEPFSLWRGHWAQVKTELTVFLGGRMRPWVGWNTDSTWDCDQKGNWDQPWNQQVGSKATLVCKCVPGLTDLMSPLVPGKWQDQKCSTIFFSEIHWRSGWATRWEKNEKYAIRIMKNIPKLLNFIIKMGRVAPCRNSYNENVLISLSVHFVMISSMRIYYLIKRICDY